MNATKTEIWHGDIMAMKSLLPYPPTFICFQDYIKIGDIMAKVKRVCIEWGKEFAVFPARTKKGWGKYCSLSCARKNKRFTKHRTKPERIFEEICKKNTLPFCNDSNSKLWIGKNPSINPDFVESSGKKVAIFVNGDYWHSPLLRYNIRPSQRADEQVRICKRHRWVPLILWETDLLREDAEVFVLKLLKKEGIKW